MLYRRRDLFQYNAPYEVVVSVDSDGLLEYWTGPKYEYKFPKNVLWEYKTDTDLYEFMKVICLNSQHPRDAACSVYIVYNLFIKTVALFNHINKRV